MKKSVFAALHPAVGAGQSSAAGRLPAGKGGIGRGCCLIGSPGLLSALPAPGGSLPGTDTGSPETAAFTGDAEVFLIEDQSTGEVQQVPRRDYLIGAVAAEMPLSWPDEALKAQAVAAHSYVLYCRDHATAANGAWLSADPARRQGYLTDAVLHSYWGTCYDANYVRLSALVDSVLTQVLCYEGAPAGTSYFAISNGRTEASENALGCLPPLSGRRGQQHRSPGGSL